MELFPIPRQHKPFDCVGLGLNAFDRIITVPKYPPADGKVAFDQLHEAAGGQVASALAALSTWGLKTRYIGRVGDDAPGRFVKESLSRRGVDVDGLLTVSGANTQQALIVADRSDHSRTIFWNRDDRLTIAPESISPETIASADLLLLDGHDEVASIQAARHAQEAAVPIVLDIDQPRARSREPLELVDCVFSTRRFAEKFTGALSLEDALIQLHQLGPVLVGVTLGAAGCLAYREHSFEKVPSFEVQQIDSTGAGDMFHAGLIYGMLQRWPLRRVLRFANAAGALATTRPGVQSDLPSLSEIQTLLGDER